MTLKENQVKNLKGGEEICVKERIKKSIRCFYLLCFSNRNNYNSYYVFQIEIITIFVFLHEFIIQILFINSTFDIFGYRVIIIVNFMIIWSIKIKYLFFTTQSPEGVK